MLLALLLIQQAVALRALRSSRDPGSDAARAPICQGASIHEVARLTPDDVVLAAFDSGYVEDAISFARQAEQRGLSFVGACEGEGCVRDFRVGCPNCSAHVFACAEYEVPVEEGVFQTKRCQGWRAIQFTKVFALHDFIALGKNVLVTDLDRHVPRPDVFRLAEGEGADFVAVRRSKRDTLDFGAFYARNTAGTRNVTADLASEVKHDWDQAAWNGLLQKGELQGTVSCKLASVRWLGPAGLVLAPAGLVPRTKRRPPTKRRSPLRCGLSGIFGVHDDRHPLCNASLSGP